MNRREFVTAALALPALSACRSARSRPGTGSALERLGASTACLAGLPLLEALAQLQRLGFGTVEMIAYTGARHSVGDIPGFDFQQASAAERQRVFAATRGFRHISAHLPFQDLQLVSSDATARRRAVERAQAAMDGLAYLRGELAVMHLGWPERGRSYRDLWEPTLDTLRSLGDYAAQRGLRLGLETMQPGSVREYTELIRAVDHPAVGATIDTGHIRGSEDIGLPAERRHSEEGRARFNDVLQALVEGLGDRVLHVHLSDVRPADWQDHRSLGSGIVDFPRFFRTLRRVDYRGLLVLELEEPDTLGALRASRAHVAQLLDP